jgi:hypothetical protein
MTLSSRNRLFPDPGGTRDVIAEAALAAVRDAVGEENYLETESTTRSAAIVAADLHGPAIHAALTATGATVPLSGPRNHARYILAPGVSHFVLRVTLSTSHETAARAVAVAALLHEDSSENTLLEQLTSDDQAVRRGVLGEIETEAGDLVNTTGVLGEPIASSAHAEILATLLLDTVASERGMIAPAVARTAVGTMAHVLATHPGLLTTARLLASSRRVRTAGTHAPAPADAARGPETGHGR